MEIKLWFHLLLQATSFEKIPAPPFFYETPFLKKGVKRGFKNFFTPGADTLLHD